MSTPDQQSDEEAWDAAAEKVDIRAVRALRSQGVRVDCLQRAAKLLGVQPTDTVTQLKFDAEVLRGEIPSWFEAPPSAPNAAASDAPSSMPGKGVAAGREKARELGWAKPEGVSPAEKGRAAARAAGTTP